MAQGSFKSSLGTFAAVAGSVVGLGNIWRFPYLAGQNGGFAFLVVYLIVALLVSMPVMLCEFSVGRSQRCNAMRSFKNLSAKPWFLVGFLGVATAYIIDSFYTIVGGWSLKYLAFAVSDSFKGQTAEQIKQGFADFSAGGLAPALWGEVSLVLAVLIVLMGVTKGIERICKIMMPALVVILLILAVNSVFFLPDSRLGLEFLFKPDFSKITFHTVLTAMGQSFFSLSLGMGAMLTYGSYMRNTDSLPSVAIRVVVFDSIVAILSGLVIFPAVFSFGVEPTQGPSLLFVVMPNIFQQISGGYLISIIFFLFVFIAAITSQVSLLEVVTAYASEELNVKRWKAVLGIFVTMTVVSQMCAFSLSDYDLFRILGMPLFDVFDWISSNVMLPLGGLFIVIFAGWIMPERILYSQLTNENNCKNAVYVLLRFLIKFVSPVFVSVMFLSLIGLI